ncbi:MAG: hypothetical protein IPI35_21265 [Deltaproteobacteria bacterium]|nr:hypothetical protein [Deltaproteobacteria bacterium]
MSDEAQRGAGDPFEAAPVGVSLASAGCGQVGGGSAEASWPGPIAPAVWAASSGHPGTLTPASPTPGCRSVGALPVGDDNPGGLLSQGPTDDGRLKPELVGPKQREHP